MVAATLVIGDDGGKLGKEGDAEVQSLRKKGCWWIAIGMTALLPQLIVLNIIKDDFFTLRRKFILINQKLQIGMFLITKT